MKLYDLPRTEKGTTVRLVEDIIIEADFFTLKKGGIFIFYFVDGMYSRCQKDDVILRLPATTEVEVVRCKYVRKEGESCTLNNNCKYPNCDFVNK